MPIEKHLVEFHSSVAVIFSPKVNRLFMSVYEKGYPQRAYRNKPNTIGGNPSVVNGIRDLGPLVTLERELREEINPDHPEELEFGYTELWAPREQIRLIRDSVLENLDINSKFRDYFVNIKRIGSPEEKMNLPGSGIFSVFCSQISQATLDCLEYNINTMRRTITEGYAGTFTIDQLVKAAKIDPYQISCAHLTPIILNDFFFPINRISHPGNITVKSTDNVRNSYENYLNDNNLEHKDSWLRR